MVRVPAPSASPLRPEPVGSGESGETRAPDALWARYRASGDPRDLGAFFDATAPALLRIAISLLHDATVAEDVVQETFLAALEHADRHDPERPVLPWFVGVLRNHVHRARRDTHRVPDPARLTALRAALAGDETTPASVAVDEDARRLRAAIEDLPEPYRAVALLRYRYGLSPAEIADVRAENPGTTRSLLSRALDRLRVALRGAPAFLLLPPAPRGLDAVRTEVLARADALLAASMSASAGAAVPLSLGLVWKVSAGLALAVGVGALAVGLGSGAAPRHDGAPSSVAGAPAAAVTGPAPADEVGPPADLASDAPPSASPATDAPLEPAPPDVADPTPAAPPVAPAPEPPPVETPPPPEAEDARPGVTAPPEPVLPPLEPPVPKLSPVDPSAPPPPPVDPAADAAGVTPSLAVRIDAGIDRAIAYLRSVQGFDGSFGVVRGNRAYESPSDVRDDAGAGAYGHPAGPTALALFALLKSGVPLDDPAVRRGFAFLRQKHRVPNGSYEVATLLLAVTATASPPPRDPRDPRDPSGADAVRLRFPAGDWADWARRLHEELLRKRARARTAGWRYQLDGVAEPDGHGEDLSSTQLATLALVAAERCGLRTDPRVYHDVIAFTLRQQEPDGPPRRRAVALPGLADDAYPQDRARGFAYLRSKDLPADEGAATGAMTACGVATLQLARYALLRRGDRAFPRDAATVQQAIFDGLAWLEHRWSPWANPGKSHLNVYHVYYLYCVERAFDLLGAHRLGARFWYVEMAEQLLGRQLKHGGFDSETAHEPRGVLDTSFALLFLKRSSGGFIPNPSLTDPSDR